MVDAFDENRRTAIAHLHTDPEMLTAVAAQFRRDAESDLNQSHDFMQMIKLIKGYAESLLYAKFPKLPPEEAADHLKVEGAIYFATLLMTMKVDALLFIHEMNRAVGNETVFQIHPLILKYVRIYNWQASQKGLTIRLNGTCFASCRYNSPAIGAVIQALLDNLVKYAPANSNAEITFVENVGAVDIVFSSLGPRILADEMAEIFLPRVRAKAARIAESAGQGIGLAAARQVSDVLGLQVRVSQRETEDSHFPGRFATEFAFTLSTLS